MGDFKQDTDMIVDNCSARTEKWQMGYLATNGEDLQRTENDSYSMVWLLV